MATSSTKSKKPKLDEASFQKLLAAAFVVQEHQEQVKVSNPSESVSKDPSLDEKELPARPAYAFVMEEIVATQHQIQTRHLQLQQSIDLITQRVRSIVRADGAAVVLTDEHTGELVYRTAIGTSSVMAGKHVPLANLLCAESVRNGTTLQCLDAAHEFRIDQSLCASRGVRGLIAAPVYRDDLIAGVLEVVFSRTNAFVEQDVRSCQVMAGMVTEVLQRDAESELKKTIVDERATMLKALEQLKPQLQRLVDREQIQQDRSNSCANCKQEFSSTEQVCPHCGSPVTPASLKAPRTRSNRLADKTAESKTSTRETSLSSGHRISSSGLLKAPAKPLRPTEIPQGVPEEPVQSDFELPSSVIDELEKTLREYDPDRHGKVVQENADEASDRDSQLSSEIASDTHDTASMPADLADTAEADDNPAGNASSENVPASSQNVALVPQTNPPGQDSDELAKLRITPASAPEEPWSSAWNTKAWFESITDRRTSATILRYINRYRGEIYLGTAIIVVGFAVWWSIWGGTKTSVGGIPVDSATPGASRRRPRPPEADLSMYERFLVAVGLAEAPPPPVYEGNPDTKVWVDLQTGLYYCPNADLYGTTPKGRFTTQKDAQLDQFEPANRKACE